MNLKTYLQDKMEQFDSSVINVLMDDNLDNRVENNTMDTLESKYSPESIKKRIFQIDEIFADIDNHGELDNNIKLNKNGMSEELKIQIDIIDECMPKKSLEAVIIEFLDSNSDQKSSLSSGNIVKMDNDDLVIECFIIQQLLEFGMIASLNILPNMSETDHEIVRIVENYGPYHLFELFHKNLKIRDEMVRTFVKYNYHSPKLIETNDTSYLDGFKDKLVFEYYLAILYREKKASEKVGNNKITVEELRKIIINSGYNIQFIMKKGR